MRSEVKALLQALARAERISEPFTLLMDCRRLLMKDLMSQRQLYSIRLAQNKIAEANYCKELISELERTVAKLDALLSPESDGGAQHSLASPTAGKIPHRPKEEAAE